MSKLYKPTAPRAPQRGFTLVELMVTVAIAVFLLFGLVKVVENIRGANSNQQALALLQDEQRFAMTVLTDVIQQGGYFPSPTDLHAVYCPAAPSAARRPGRSTRWRSPSSARTPLLPGPTPSACATAPP